jgi:hypothetical protein
MESSNLANLIRLDYKNSQKALSKGFASGVRKSLLVGYDLANRPCHKSQFRTSARTDIGSAVVNLRTDNLKHAGENRGFKWEPQKNVILNLPSHAAGQATPVFGTWN